MSVMTVSEKRRDMTVQPELQCKCPSLMENRVYVWYVVFPTFEEIMFCVEGEALGCMQCQCAVSGVS